MIKKFGYRWWSYRARELATATVLAGALMFAREGMLQRGRAQTSPDAWFVINRIEIPNFKIGSNPIMMYDRQIKVPFRGFWVAEVSRRDAASGLFVLECSGSGINDYDPADYIPNNLVKWNWFTGDRCKEMDAGEYQVRVTWVMKKLGWPDKTTSVYSNVFAVTGASPTRP